MKIISTSYINSPQFKNPDEWLYRIRAYTGILEELATSHEVASIERISYEGTKEQNGVYYHFVNLGTRVSYLPVKIHRIIQRFEPDVVLVNGLMFPFQVLQLKRKLKEGAKIFCFHRAEKPFHGYRRFLHRLADRCVDGYFFTAAEMGEPWIKSGNIKSRDKIHEVIQASSTFSPAGPNVSQSKLRIEGSPVYLWVGRLNANKDPMTVVRAFTQFLKVHPPARLYMIHQSDELLHDIKNLIAAEGCDDQIILLGQRAHEDLQHWYNASGFVVSGSHSEGSGIAVSEAMSCGCIPIITDIPSFRQMTGNGQCGFLYKPGSEQQLLNLLTASTQIDIPAEQKKVLEQFRTELSFEAIVGKINRIIQ